MMLEFNDPKVLVESSKFAVLPIFAYFFRAIWEDRSVSLSSINTCLVCVLTLLARKRLDYQRGH